MKFLISLPLSAATVALLFYLDDQKGDWMTLSALAILFSVSFTRLAEYLLMKPMWVAGWFGIVRQWKLIPPEQSRRRLLNLILYLAFVAVFCWLYFQLGGDEKDTPSEGSVEVIHNETN